MCRPPSLISMIWPKPWALPRARRSRPASPASSNGIEAIMASEARLTHLQALEAESIHILRETAAEIERPVMLYSMGKDSGVLLHLAKKAFFPAKQPFTLLHVDTNWKFRDMYAMRDRAAAEHKLVVYRNPDAVAKNINPFDHGSELHTHLWKTEGLRQALAEFGFDAAIGGARRDE